jgi:hypothetical protein
MIPWGVLKIIKWKKAGKFQWLQNPSQLNTDNLNNEKNVNSYKEGDETDYSNYRRISLLPTTYTVYPKFVFQR